MLSIQPLLTHAARHAALSAQAAELLSEFLPLSGFARELVRNEIPVLMRACASAAQNFEFPLFARVMELG
jgi:hypothetical protein